MAVHCMIDLSSWFSVFDYIKYKPDLYSGTTVDSFFDMFSMNIIISTNSGYDSIDSDSSDSLYCRCGEPEELEREISEISITEIPPYIRKLPSHSYKRLHQLSRNKRVSKIRQYRLQPIKRKNRMKHGRKNHYTKLQRKRFRNRVNVHE